MLQYWMANPPMAPANVPVLPDPDLVLPNPVPPEADILPQPAKVDIEAFIRDMAMYARCIDELGPEATVGLIFHMHKRLQDSLLPSSRDSTHTHPVAPPCSMTENAPVMRHPGLLPSLLIVCPGTGESHILEDLSEACIFI
jgi:hypothetical protein